MPRHSLSPTHRTHLPPVNYRRDWIPRLMVCNRSVFKQGYWVLTFYLFLKPLIVLIAAGKLLRFNMWTPVTEIAILTV